MWLKQLTATVYKSFDDKKVGNSCNHQLGAISLFNWIAQESAYSLLHLALLTPLMLSQPN